MKLSSNFPSFCKKVGVDASGGAARRVQRSFGVRRHDGLQWAKVKVRKCESSLRRSAQKRVCVCVCMWRDTYRDVKIGGRG